MASTTWVSELPSSAAAWCADVRSVWSILIVRCGRRPDALATRRCGNGGGGSHGTAGSRSGSRSPDPPVRRRTRACTACRLTPRASASERSGQPASVSPASVPDSSSLRPDERSSRSRAATRSGSRGQGVPGVPAGARGYGAGAGSAHGRGGLGGIVPPATRIAAARASRPRTSSGPRGRAAPGAAAAAPGPAGTSAAAVTPATSSRCGEGQAGRRDGIHGGHTDARPQPGRGTGVSRRRAAAGSSRAGAP